MEGTQSEQLLVFDWQILFRDGQRNLYHHRAMRPNTIDATTDQAAVQIVFDPA